MIKEICEEFRLFHRLYHDRKSDQYLKIDDDGNEDLVAVVEPDHVQIRLKELRQFLAIVENQSLRAVSVGILRQTLDLLNFFIDVVRSGRISAS